MTSQRDKNAMHTILLIIGCAVAAIWLFLSGGNASIKNDADRDFRIRATELEQWRSEDRIQKQLDDLRQRVEKLEARQ